MIMDRKFEITDATGGSAFTVRVVTRSNVTELAGWQEDGALRVLKVRLQAEAAGTPEANTELLGFLAAYLEVDNSRLQIVAGETRVDKLISVDGLSAAEVNAKFGVTNDSTSASTDESPDAKFGTSDS
jgi:uncharacterized protein YggU (UPF0235/DUF167 family)